MTSNLKIILLLLNRLADNLVINIGDVHNKLNIVAKVVTHQAIDNVEADVSSGVSQMRFIVHGGSTCVPRYLVRIVWCENILF